MWLSQPRPFFLWNLLLLLTLRSASSEPTYEYGVIFDAGSSGTRVNIYRWETPPGRQSLLVAPTSDAYVQAVMGTLTQVGQKKIRPGISSFAAHIPEHDPSARRGTRSAA